MRNRSRMRFFAGAAPPSRHSREMLKAMFDVAAELKKGELIVTTDESEFGAGTHWLYNDIDLHARGRRQPEIWARKVVWFVNTGPSTMHCSP